MSKETLIDQSRLDALFEEARVKLNTVVDILHPVIDKLIADEHDSLTIVSALATTTTNLAVLCMGHDTFVHLLNVMHNTYDDAQADLEKVKQ